MSRKMRTRVERWGNLLDFVKSGILLTFHTISSLNTRKEINLSKNAKSSYQNIHLHAALTETIRLYPALPADPKHCFSDDVLPDGCSVKKGDLVCFLPYAMGRMTFICGDDALEFKPERWLDENGCFHQASPFKFTAFQAGPRTCLGRDFAYRQMKIVASIVLGCFMFKLSDEKFVPRYRMSINLHIDGQLQVNVFNRLALKNPQT